MKDFLGSQESGHSVFNFKPQQLLQTSTGSPATSIQVAQPKNVPIATSTPRPVHQLITSQTGNQIVIRTQQQPAVPRQITVKPTPPKTFHIMKQPPQPQLVSLVVAPGSKLPNDFQLVKSIPPAATPRILYNPVQKTFQVLTPKATLAHPTVTKTILKDARPILPKPNNVQQKAPHIKQVVLSQRRAAPLISQMVSSTSTSSIPALTPIQTKVAAPVTILHSTVIKKATVIDQHQEKEEFEEVMDDESIEDEIDTKEEEEEDEIIQKLVDDEEEYLNVKRIIEGDEELNNYVVTQNTSSNNNNTNNNNDVADNVSKNITKKNHFILFFKSRDISECFQTIIKLKWTIVELKIMLLNQSIKIVRLK